MRLRGRRRLRAIALQILYEIDIMDQWESYKKVLKNAFERERIYREEDKKFIENIVICVINNRGIIDTLIKRSLKDWDFDRLNIVERNIMRIGACELLFSDEIPYKVAINEAVEVAKIFAQDGAPSLINGVLDRIAKEKGVKK